MRVILFVGHHKVGSSALQSYFAQNAKALRRRGVLYPAVERRGMWRMRTAALFDIRRKLHVNIREAHNALAFRMLSDVTGQAMPRWHSNLPGTDEMIANICRQIDRYRPHTVVLVAEVLANFGLQTEPLIAELLSPFDGADLTISATLRRPDEYAISWMAQLMRFGQKSPRLSDGLKHGGIHDHYRLMIEPWINTAKRADIRLTNYADVLAKGGAVRAFFAENDLQLVSNRNIDKQSNSGLHRGLIEIARRGNWDLEKSQSRALFRYMLSMGRELDLPKSSEIEMYGAQQRAILHKRFEPCHDYLSQIQGKPFFPDFDAILQERPMPEAEANVIGLEKLNGASSKRISGDIQTWLRQLDVSRG